HPAVREAAVLARPWKGRTDDLRLVAYVARAPEIGIDSAGLREHLARRLPAYMVPAAWVLLDELPHTPNGKVDRKALPEPAEGAGAAPGAEEAILFGQGDPREALVRAIWAEVLDLPAGVPIASEASFFDLGGHSLLAARVIARVR